MIALLVLSLECAASLPGVGIAPEMWRHGEEAGAGRSHLLCVSALPRPPSLSAWLPQEDAVDAALEKVRKAVEETRTVNLARTTEILRMIQNEGTFLESKKQIREQAEVYARSAEALTKALEAQENKTGATRRSILTLQKAVKRAEKKKSDEAKVGTFRYAFAKTQLAFQVESAEVGALVGLGLECFQGGLLEEAEEALQEAEERLPSILGKDVETTDKNARLAPMILAQVYLAGSRYPEAGAAARRSIDLVPDLADEEIPLRKLHKDGEAYDSALRKLDEHVGKNPDDLDARFLLGYQVFFSPESAKSKALFESILEKKRDDKGAAYFLERLK